MTNFFIGSSPSMASQIINPNAKYAATGAMISLTSLRDRKSDFQVKDWILDSGAFTEIARHGHYHNSVAEHAAQIKRWSNCGNLLIAVAQDYMCEPFVLEKTGLSVTKHQQLTIDRYDRLLNLNPVASIMPVLQGYKVSDYLTHLQAYGDRFKNGQWVGVGSVCRRNGKPDEIKEIFKTIKLIRPDLKLHGFGIKKIALADKEIQTLLYSTDSIAWSYPRKFDSVRNLRQPLIDSVNNQSSKEKELCLAQEYQQKISVILNNSVLKHIPPNAGAGNGQGRKPKWKSGKTKAIRVPEIYTNRLLEIAKEWDEKKLKFKISVELCDLKWAQELVTEKHYLHRPIHPLSLPFAYKISFLGQSIGTVIMATVHYVKKKGLFGYQGLPTKWQVLQIARLWIDPIYQQKQSNGHANNIASCAISKILRRVNQDWLKHHPPRFLDQPYNIKLILAYADTGVGHQGIVYSAANFVKWGKTNNDRSRHGNKKTSKEPKILYVYKID